MYETDKEEFETLTPEYETDEPCVDSTEVLLERYDRRRSQKIDDIFAMQALVCVLIAAAAFAANLLFPDIFSVMYEKMKMLTSDENEVMPNLIDVVTSI